MGVGVDMEKFTQDVSRFVKAWGEAITESFKPFNEAVARMQGQEDVEDTEDVEIQAIRGCVAHINKLDTETAGRVVRYLADRFGYDA